MKYSDIPHDVHFVAFIPVKAALITFAAGTVLLLLLLCGLEGVSFIGFFYIVAATVFNAVILLAMLLYLIFHKQYWKFILQRSGVILINIPLIYLYILLL